MEELSDIRVEETDLSISVDSLVYGTILSIDKDGIWLDIGKKYDAFLPNSEISKELNLKLQKRQEVENIPVIIQNVNFKDGIITVSNKKAVEKQIWEELLWLYENNEPVKGRIVDYKGRGFIVEIKEEVEGYIPFKEVDIPPLKPYKFYLNRRVEGKIVKLNPEKNQLIISVREILEKKQEEKKLNLWEKIKNSDIVRGKVVKIEEDSLSLDLGLGILGIVEKDEISWFPIKNLRRYFDLGDIVKAKVISLNEESKIAQLSIKQTQPNPWALFKERYPIGSIVEGEIIKILNGLLIKIENLVGYVPPTEITWGKIQEVKENLNVGDKVKVKILNIDEINQKILLSLKQVEPNPWEVVDNLFKVGDVVRGRITNITNFGIFIEIKPGLEGLIPRRYVAWERIDDLSQKFKIGEFVEAKVIDIDKLNKKLTLSRKDLFKDPWEDAENKYKELQNIKGKVIDKVKDGYIVELEPGIEAFLPFTQTALEKETEKVDLDINTEIEAKIIKINSQNRKILLSIKALLKERLEQEIKEHLKEFLPPPLTLGEILKLKSLNK